jgi:hypothetical protein
MWHVWDRIEMPTEFLWVKKKSDIMKVLALDVRKWVMRKRIG